MIEAREAITTLNDLQQRLGLVQTQNVDFFPEWVDDLPSLTAQQQAGIDRIKQRYDYHRTGFWAQSSKTWSAVSSNSRKVGETIGSLPRYCLTS